VPLGEARLGRIGLDEMAPPLTGKACPGSSSSEVELACIVWLSLGATLVIPGEVRVVAPAPVISLMVSVEPSYGRAESFFSLPTWRPVCHGNRRRRTMGPHEEAVMTKHGVVRGGWQCAILLGASVLLSAPAAGSAGRGRCANPGRGLKDAKVAFDITAGDAGRVLNILKHDRRDARVVHQARHHARTSSSPSAPRDPADADRRLAAEARRARDGEQGGGEAQGAPWRGRHRAPRPVQHRHARQKVDKAQVNPDVTIVRTAGSRSWAIRPKATRTSRRRSTRNERREFMMAARRRIGVMVPSTKHDVRGRLPAGPAAQLHRARQRLWLTNDALGEQGICA